jgi:hypothetical protein
MGCTLLWSTELSEVDVCTEVVETVVMAHLAKNHLKAGERRWSPHLLRQQPKPDAAQ